MSFVSTLRRIFADDRSGESEWDGVIDMMRKMGCPAKREFMGGNIESIMVVGEDPKDYVLMGAGKDDLPDGYWINIYPRAECNMVGGAHFLEKDEDYGDFDFSEPVLMDVFGDPTDDHDMAAALVECWRKARTAPTDYGSN